MTERKPSTSDDRYDDKDRLKVSTADRNPVDVADEVVSHLLESNDPPELFSMGAASAVLLRNGAELVSLDADGWLTYVARKVTFTQPTSRGGPKIVQAPGSVMKMIPTVLIPKLPPLDGIATTPYLDRDGTVIAANGYYAATRLVLYIDGDVPVINPVPDADEVGRAVKILTDDWLIDFPFESDSDRANAIAVLLTLTGRMFFSLAPLFVFDASAAGSGKGLLITTISLIATGEDPHTMELPPNAEEQRKVITSALMAGQELIMWDEAHRISGKSLASILTAEKYSDRLLGSNKMITVRNRFTQVSAGNNVQVWGDMKRRVVPCRIVPPDEDPGERTGFKHKELPEWVRAHRWELLAAVLTIWRNWIAKGRPESHDVMGSFDRWARTVGGALQAAGVEGFRTNTKAWLSQSSEDDDTWAGHLAQLRDRYDNRWFTPADVAAAVEAGHLADPPIKRDPSKTLASQLPYGWRNIRGATHGGLRIVRSDSRDSPRGSYTWSVQRTHAEPGESSPVSSVSPAKEEELQVNRHEEADYGSLEMEVPGAASSVSPVAPHLSALEMSRASPVSPVSHFSIQLPGQNRSTGDTGDTGDTKSKYETNDWPVDSIGATANDSAAPGRAARG
jgi:hypothetical protein